MSFSSIQRMYNNMNFDGGFKLLEVSDLYDKKLEYIVNETMMRVELTKSLKKGQKFSFKINYFYNIKDNIPSGCQVIWANGE